MWSKRVIGLLTMVAVSAMAVPAAAQDGPLDVDEAVRIALRQNFGYQQNVAGVGVAEGTRLDALAGLLPSVAGSATYSKSKTTQTLKDIALGTVRNAANPFGTVIERGDISTESRSSGSAMSLSLAQGLSFPLWYNYRSAQANVQGARYGREAAAQLLAFNVRSQFYSVLMAKDLLQVQEEALKLATDDERRINSMFELGSVARVDVLKARVNVSDAEVELIRQQNAVDIEAARLATMLGLPPYEGLELVGELKAEFIAVDSLAVASEARGRPDLRQAEENLRSANNLYKAAALSRLPGLFASFDLSTSFGESESEQIQSLDFPEVPNPGDTTSVLFAFPIPKSDLEFDQWTLRVGASVNLDAFLNMGQHKRTRAQKRQAQYYLEDLELDIQREIEEAILNYRASFRAIEAAERGVESAQEDLRLSQERYQQGLGTVLELLESQVNLTRARNKLVVAQASLKISEAALDKARGAPLPY